MTVTPLSAHHTSLRIQVASQVNEKACSQIADFAIQRCHTECAKLALEKTLHLVRSQDTLIDAALIVCEAPVGWEAARNIAAPRNDRGQPVGTALRAL